jgi:hypothetical protein
MWWWGRRQRIGWTDLVKNKEVLHRVKKERNIVRTIIKEEG